MSRGGANCDVRWGEALTGTGRMGPWIEDLRLFMMSSMLPAPWVGRPSTHTLTEGNINPGSHLAFDCRAGSSPACGQCGWVGSSHGADARWAPAVKTQRLTLAVGFLHFRFFSPRDALLLLYIFLRFHSAVVGVCRRCWSWLAEEPTDLSLLFQLIYSLGIGLKCV